MERPLPRRQHIRMAGVQRERSAPAMQRNPRTRHDQSRPKVRVHAVYQRAGIPFAVHTGDVNRIAVRRLHAARNIVHSMFFSNESPTPRRVALRYQPSRVHPHLRRVRYVIHPVRQREPCALYQVVMPVRRLRPHRPDVESFRDIQPQQHIHPLVVRRALPNINTAIIRSDRLLPGCLVLRYVISRQPPAPLLHERRNPLSYLPLVERVRSAIRNRPQRIRERRHAHNLTRTRRSAAQQQFFAAMMLFQTRLRAFPLVRYHLRHRIPALGIVNRRPQHIRHLHIPEPVQ